MCNDKRIWRLYQFSFDDANLYFEMLFVVFYLFLQHFCFDSDSFHVLWWKRCRKFITFLTLECWSLIQEAARHHEIHPDQDGDPPWSFSSQKQIWIHVGPWLEDIWRMEMVWPSLQCQFHLSLSSSSLQDPVLIFYSATCPVNNNCLYKQCKCIKKAYKIRRRIHKGCSK